jgi:hypothetical protein
MIINSSLLGIVILILISLCVLIFTDVKLLNLLSLDGIKEEFKNKGIILIVVIGILFYGFYQIIKHNKENFTNFDSVIIPDQNKLYLLRTIINDKVYYLINDEVTKEKLVNFYYRSRDRPNTFIGELKSTVCKGTNETYIQPVLIREDVLLSSYNSYLRLPKYLENRNEIFSETDNVPDIRYTHHWNINTHPIDSNNYLISGYTNPQLIGEYSLSKYVLTGKQSLDENYVHKDRINGLNFACMSQDPEFGEMSKFGMEFVPREDVRLDEIDEKTKMLIGTEDYERLDGNISIFIEVNGKKFYLSMLDEFRRQDNMENTDHPSHYPLSKIPIGFIPENYEKGDLYESSPMTNIQNEYNFANKINFDLISINL